MVVVGTVVCSDAHYDGTDKLQSENSAIKFRKGTEISQLIDLDPLK